MSRVSQLFLIASFDFFESVRSKKALALLVLYLAGSLASSYMFIRFVIAFENTAAETLLVGTTDTAGAMTEELMKSKQLLRFFSELVGDEELAANLLSIPPMALFYGWLALTFIPVVVTLTSGDAAAMDTASGACRYSLFRTDRLTWAGGKLLGQGLLMSLGILGGAAMVMLLDVTLVEDSHRFRTLTWLVRFSGRAWIYGFTYLGMAVGMSLLAKSINGARAAAFAGLFVLGVGGNLLEAEWTVETFPMIAPTLSQLFPQGHDLDMWRVSFVERLPGVVMLLSLGAVYFSAGYFFFARRDP